MTKFRKRRNTVCIVSFLNCRIGAKDPVKAADELCGAAPIISYLTENRKGSAGSCKEMGRNAYLTDVIQ